MKTNIATFFAALGILILSGCITSRQPATVDAGAFDQPLPAIHVMPVIDARDDKSGTLEAEDIQRIRDLTKSKLNDLGYQTVMVDSWRRDASASGQELGAMNDAALSRLAPEESQIILVITVNNIDDTYAGLMTSYSISGKFALIDRAKGTAVWKDRGKGSHGGGGIIGSAVVYADRRIEAQTAFVNVLSALPQNKK